MIFSNTDIKSSINSGNLIIENFNEECIRPSSYLLRIDYKFLKIKEGNEVIDTKNDDTTIFFEEILADEKGMIIYPGEFLLASSIEKISFDESICGDLFQLSCYARIGLQLNFSSCHVAATFGKNNPSSITFEIFNSSKRPIKIYPNVKFCHLRIQRQLSPSSIQYNGIYSGKNDAMPSNFNRKPAK
jgi:dCTP deaminase